MNKLLLTALSLLVSAGMASARTISVEEAQSIATEFISGGNSGMLKKQGAALQSADLEASHLYGFNIAGGGYVIVSGDSRTYQILGYSDSGSLDEETMPAAMRAWLESYDSTIAALGAQPLAEGSEPLVCGAAVEPLLSTTWYQMEPYNELCPSLPDEKGVDTKCPTGCVATAMAQVMYFHKWPESCPAIPEYTFGYTTNVNEVVPVNVPEIPATTFEWDDMLLNYSDGTATEAQNAAVAKLMKYCGQAVQMSYAPEGSGAMESAIAQSLRYYFNYDPALYSAKRIYYSIDEWENLIYSELAAGRPVPYAGGTDTSGHSFVCDGYDGAGMFHINWGWDGRSDGYFSLSVLNPYNNTSVGSSSSRLGFSFYQEAIIGVQRPVEGSVPVEENFSIALSECIGLSSANIAYVTIQHESILGTHTIGVALATIDGDVITPVIIDEPIELAHAWMAQFIFKLNPDEFPEGKTILYPVARVEDGAHTWQRIASNEHRIEINKSGEECTMIAYPDPFVTATMSFENPDQQIGEEGVINIDFSFDSEYTGSLYYTVFEAGDISIGDPELATVMPFVISSARQFHTNGYAARPNEPIHESFKYTPHIPGTIFVSMWRENGSEPILTSLELKAKGELDFVDMEVFDYDIQTTVEGDMTSVFYIRNIDTRAWNIPSNSAAGIFVYVEGYLSDFSTMTDPVEPMAEFAIPYENYFWMDDIEPGSEITVVVEQRYGLKNVKELFRKTLTLGDNLKSTIDTLVDSTVEGDVWYNLQGVRINEPTIPGIYIHNGAKVVIR